MYQTTANGIRPEPLQTTIQPLLLRKKRVLSIDVVRGAIMIIMALDHVRDYFHRDAFFYSPTDLSRTSGILFFTRWITHFCAPAFVCLAGISASLYGSVRGKKALSFFLLTRGLWLVFAEFFIITLMWTFNPAYPVFNLQVIWAIGISMIVLSALIRLDWRIILAIGVLLVAGHDLLDSVHVQGRGLPALLWAMLHEEADLAFGRVTIFVHFPVLPWIGIMAIGYVLGRIYQPGYDGKHRKAILLWAGGGAILLFFALRCFGLYGDPAPWSVQPGAFFSFLSFINVSKYPPSLLYTLVTLGPILIFLAFSEKPLNALTERVSVFGRVPMFFYLLHIPLIHALAIVGATVSGYPAGSMILGNRVNRVHELQGYGFSLPTVYLVWASVVLALYPLCRWFDRYKRKHASTKWWLSYL